MFNPISLKHIASQKWFINKQIILQKFEAQDAAELFLLTNNNRNYLRQWLGWVDGVKKEQDSLNFINHANNNIEQNNSLTFGIFFDSILVGVIGFHEINWQEKQAGIGYWLGEKFQGKGIIALACHRLIDIGFKKLGLKHITIACAEGNVKSQNVPKSLGFTKGETLGNKEWLYNRFVDHIVYFCESKL